MTKKNRTTVRFNDLIDSKVEVLMRRRSFTNFTAFLEQLIRDDWDERATPEMESELAGLVKQVSPTPKRTGAAESLPPLKSGTVKARGNRNKTRAKEKASN